MSEQRIPGVLYLIPTVIADNTAGAVIPAHVRSILPGISKFLAEDVRTARRYLSSLKIYDSIESLSFTVLNKDTDPRTIPEMMQPLLAGESMGILSESGCPGVADPGAMAVQYAHKMGVKVVPLVGPSSILLALMASGLNGQRFAFHGYLPVEPKETARAIQELELESRQKGQTQVFIETPYRNKALFENLLRSLKDQTLLCCALDITGATEFIKTATVAEWKRHKGEWPKVPAIFLFLAAM